MTDDVGELAAWVREYGSAQKLLAQHAPDGEGRCPVCRGGNASSGRVVGPCTLYRAAERASEGAG
jgi:hypothetical protein